MFDWLRYRRQQRREVRNLRTALDVARNEWLKSGALESCTVINLHYRLEEALDAIEFQKAERLGLDIPSQYISDDLSIMGNTKPTSLGRTWIRREVRKEELATVKRYTEILIPVLSLGIALIALLKHSSTVVVQVPPH